MDTGGGVPGFGNGRPALAAVAAACATWVLTLCATVVQATVIAVTRPGVITLSMIMMLFTPAIGPGQPG